MKTAREPENLRVPAPVVLPHGEEKSRTRSYSRNPFLDKPSARSRRIGPALFRHKGWPLDPAGRFADGNVLRRVGAAHCGTGLRMNGERVRSRVQSRLSMSRRQRAKPVRRPLEAGVVPGTWPTAQSIAFPPPGWHVIFQSRPERRIPWPFPQSQIRASVRRGPGSGDFRREDGARLRKVRAELVVRPIVREIPNEKFFAGQRHGGHFRR